MKQSLLTIGLAAVLILFRSVTVAQTAPPADTDDLQSWDDIQFTVSLNKRFALYTAGTLHLDRNISRVNEGRFGVGITYKATSRLAVTPAVTFIRYRNSAGKFRTEYRYWLRGVYKFPVKRFGLSHRSMIEYRVRPGVNIFRFRPSITIEKALPKSIDAGLTIYATEEPLYDSVSRRFSKNRFTVGFNKVLNKHSSVDIYYLRQGDNFSNPGTIDIIGTTLKFRY